VTDVVFVLLTLVVFTVMALLVGVLDRHLDERQPSGDR
jgi:hypothetical protein